MLICFDHNIESSHNVGNKDERSNLFFNSPILATSHSLGDHASLLHKLTYRMMNSILSETTIVSSNKMYEKVIVR